MKKVFLALALTLSAASLWCVLSPSCREKLPERFFSRGGDKAVSLRWERVCMAGRDTRWGVLQKEVSGLLASVQEEVDALGVVVGHSAQELGCGHDSLESALGNLVADALLECASVQFGVPMDLAVTNFGGIRVSMPQGVVTMGDVISMLPFQNRICHVRIRGDALLRLFGQLATHKEFRFQPISGARVRIRDRKVTYAEVGGKPLIPGKVYNLATIDFLLDGGDGVRIGALAQSLAFSQVLLQEALLARLRHLEERGMELVAQKDGRVTLEETPEDAIANH